MRSGEAALSDGLTGFSSMWSRTASRLTSEISRWWLLSVLARCASISTYSCCSLSLGATIANPKWIGTQRWSDHALTEFLSPLSDVTRSHENAPSDHKSLNCVCRCSIPRCITVVLPCPGPVATAGCWYVRLDISSAIARLGSNFSFRSNYCDDSGLGL